MQFRKEPNYYNRYTKSSQYHEWRALAGEVPQSAEFNEIQSALRDRIQQAGEAIFQNGDVVSGMQVIETSTATYSVNNANENKIWIDGTVHTCSNGVGSLTVPTSGWGFIGVFLERDLISSLDDSFLRDPAIHDLSGNPLGLPGANRLKLIPKWVSGPLVTSLFDYRHIGQLVGRAVLPSSGSFGTEIDVLPSLEKAKEVSTKTPFSGKFSLSSATSTASKIKISWYKNSSSSKDPAYQFDKTNLIAGKNISVSVLAENTGAGTTQAIITFFDINLSQVTAVASSPVTLTAGTKTDLSLLLTPAHVTALSSMSNVFVGVTIQKSGTDSFASDTVFYVSDFALSETIEDVRSAVFKNFKTSSNSSYKNFVPGAGSKLIIGGTGGTSIYNYILPKLPDNFKNNNIYDVVIREDEITAAEDAIFKNSYGITKEEAFVRVYPVHITYNGKIVSSLENREFTQLTNNYLSERLKKAVPNSIPASSSFLVSQSGTEQYKVDISAAEAFIEGRLVSTTAKTTLSLPAFNNNTFIPVEGNSNLPKSFEMTYSATNLSVPGVGQFNTLEDVYIDVLVEEFLVRKQPAATQYESLTYNQKDALRIKSNLLNSGINILQVVASNGTKLDQTDFTVDLNSPNPSDSHVYPIIKFNNNTKISENQNFYVYYTFKVKLVSGGNSQNLTYTSENNKNVSFAVTVGSSEQLSILGKSYNLPKLANYTAPASQGINVYVVDKEINFTPVSFISKIDIKKVLVQDLDSYVVYVSGDYVNDGPDAKFGYTATTSLNSSNTIRDISSNKKLPLAVVTVPITGSSSIKMLDVKPVTVTAQKESNAFVDDLKKLMPILLSESHLAADEKTPTSIEYKTLTSSNPAENRVISKSQYVIDPAIFPTLAGYSVETEYFYFGEGDGTYAAPLGINSNSATENLNNNINYKGLLRNVVFSVVYSTSITIKKVIVIYQYTLDNSTNTPEITGIQVQNLQ